MAKLAFYRRTTQSILSAAPHLKYIAFIIGRKIVLMRVCVNMEIARLFTCYLVVI